MAGFMKSAMSYLGMTDVAEGDEDFSEEDESSATSFDSDHSVTPMASTPAATSVPREQTKANPFQGGRVSRITTIHPKSYEDAQLVGRAIRDGVPVVLNLIWRCRGRCVSHCGLFRRRGFRRAWLHRACHSTRVPAEPSPGEHQGRRAASE